MEYILKSVLVLLLIPGLALASKYSITINNKSYDFSLDEQKQLKIGDQILSVKLQLKAIVDFVSNNFSFKHAREFTPSTTELADGIKQTAMMTPLGTVVMVQEYLYHDPSSMIDFMINEITKEEKQHGYKIDSKPTSVVLSDGTKLAGKIVTSIYKGSDIKRYVLAYNSGDSGLLIVTQIDYSLAAEDEQVITIFMDSLVITM